MSLGTKTAGPFRRMTALDFPGGGAAEWTTYLDLPGGTPINVYNIDRVNVVTHGRIASVDATPSDNTFTVTIGATSVSVPGRNDVGDTNADLVTALQAEADADFLKQTWSDAGGGTHLGTRNATGATLIDSSLTVTGVGSGTVNDNGNGRYRFTVNPATFGVLRLVDFATLTIADENGRVNTLTGDSGDSQSWALTTTEPVGGSGRYAPLNDGDDDWGIWWDSAGSQLWFLVFAGSRFGPDTSEVLELANIGT